MDDDEVEMLETIIFTFGELTNATTEETEITLNLESDDDPNLVSVEANPLEFAEHESSIITATIDQVTSRDVSISFVINGTAELGVDYSAVFDALGEESLYKELWFPQDWHILEDGRYISLPNYHTLEIYELDGSISSISLQNNATNFIVRGNEIIMRDWPVMHRLNLETLEQNVIGQTFFNGVNSEYRGSFDYVNNKLFTLVYDWTGNQNKLS